MAIGPLVSCSQGLLLFVGCLTSQQQASVSQGRICSDNFTCCHTEIEVTDQTFHLSQSQYTDTGPTSPSTDPITPGAWQGSHWSANFEVTGMTRPLKNLSTCGNQTQDLLLSRRTPLPLGQRGSLLSRQTPDHKVIESLKYQFLSVWHNWGQWELIPLSPALKADTLPQGH